MFQLHTTDGMARHGTVTTAHGSFETPMFMPVGTVATVKGVTVDQLHSVDTKIILGNTYHLTLRPGDDVVAELGGLHKFMNWQGPILTDSGGYQVFSLTTQRKITDEGARFRSHIDGNLLNLTPEKAIDIQHNLGSDIAMVLDECPPGDADETTLRGAIRRSLHWAERCQNHHSHPTQKLFAIVQGGTNIALRQECAEALVAMDFPGYALGGFSVGEAPEAMHQALPECAAMLPSDKPRYLMGVGRPIDLLAGIAAGIDMFDCTIPTRSGRNSQAWSAEGVLRFRNAKHKRDPAPLSSVCDCPTCMNYSRAYLHHLFAADEMLGPTLLSLHNIAYFLRLMKQARQAIVEGRFAEFHAGCLARWQAAP